MHERNLVHQTDQAFMNGHSGSISGSIATHEKLLFLL